MNGKVILYADKITESMRLTMQETARRRDKQSRYNAEHGITPKQIQKALSEPLLPESPANDSTADYRLQQKSVASVADPVVEYMSASQLDKAIARVRRLMNDASSRMDFLEAAQYRDEMFKLEALKK